MSSGHERPTRAPEDTELAAQHARGAGELLLELREGSLRGRELGDAGDARANDFLCGELAVHRPHDAVLSEEGADDQERRASRRVWIVDPLDGTREYTEEGRRDWAVHVALWEDGELVAGVVALPACGVLLRSDAPPPLRAMATPLRLVVSRSRAPEVASRVADALGAVILPLGSAGAKVAAVVLGEAEAYVHAGGMFEWDSAAPVAVARASGLHASRLAGGPLEYNRPEPWLPDLLVCRPAIAQAIIDLTAGSLDFTD